MEILDRVTIVAVRPSFLSGTRRLESGKETISRRKTVVMDVLDPKALSNFNQMSTSLFRLCRTYGSKVKLLDAWAVENALADELLAKLQAFDQRFKTQAEALIDAFPDLNREWARDNPEDSESILRLAYTRDELEKGFRFAYAGFRLTEEQIQKSAGLDEELEGMSGQALKEFSDQIRDMGVKDPGKHIFTGAISGVLSQIHRKAQSLSFLDKRIAEVATVVGSVIKMLPTRGKVDDATSIVLRVVVDRLMNPGELVAKGFPKLQVEEDAKPAMSPAAAAKPKVSKSVSDDDLDDTWPPESDDDAASSIASIVGNASPFDDVVAW